MQGIKFNQDGIRSILEGRKTMTRRPIKQAVRSISDNGHIRVGHGIIHHGTVEHFINECSKYKIGETVFVQEEISIDYYLDPWYVLDGAYVEAFIDDGTNQVPELNEEKYPEEYIGIVKAEDMPKECARIFLKITNIKVERLQDISEEDCIKESVEYVNTFYRTGKKLYDFWDECFEKEIWNKLPYQPPYDWNSNPYVFVYEFKVVL